MIHFIDDITRDSFWPAKEFFYQILRETIFEATGERPGASLREQLKSSATFAAWKAETVEAATKTPRWVYNYEEFEPGIAKIISDAATASTLVIGYEMSPALARLLNATGVHWIDFRISPIRFLHDLVIAIRSTLPGFNANLKRLALRASEIRLRANKLAASCQHLENYNSETAADSHPPSTLYVVGQTELDASLVDGARVLGLQDFSVELNTLCTGKRMSYLPHPAASAEHTQAEQSLLRAFCPDLAVATTNLYDAFCSRRSAEFVGISSGSLQEAELFGRKATVLFKPICSLTYPDDKPLNTSEFWQIPFQTFSQPEFFELILGLREDLERIPLEHIRSDELRTLHHVWWGYANFAGRSTPLSDAQQSNLSNRVTELENRIGGTAALFFTLPIYTSRHYRALYTQVYRWVDGARLTLSPDGNACRNGEPAGRWYAVSNDKAYDIVIVWNEGGWVDKISSDESWLVLTCINNAGRNFEVRSEPV